MKELELANVGIRDFFALLIPGAVFLILTPFGKSILIDASAYGIIVFTISAYLCGCIASGVGSMLDWIVDPLLKSRFVRRFLLRHLADRELLAEKLQKRLVRDLGEGGRLPFLEPTKSFWWDHLRLNCSQAISELDRQEAFQKLFRSLSVVSITLWAIPSRIPISIGRSFVIPDLALMWSGLVAAVVYACGRAIFLQAVYRLGAAFCAKKASQ